MEKLPLEIIVSITDRLDVNTLQMLRLCNRSFYQTIPKQKLDLSMSLPLSILKNVYKRFNSDPGILFRAVIYSGNIENIEWLYGIKKYKLFRKFKLSWELYYVAIQGNQLPSLEWLYAHQCPMIEHPFVWMTVVESNQPEMIKWFSKHNLL